MECGQVHMSGLKAQGNNVHKCNGVEVSGGYEERGLQYLLSRQIRI